MIVFRPLYTRYVILIAHGAWQLLRRLNSMRDNHKNVKFGGRVNFGF